ncbi:hypothetical protein CFR78_09130 [Komagataeibacter rhaeticus]|nr:hypothetical protein GLUCORHAEAF1_15740 [Komagataeibacter rhaeticus AF1]PYD53507.1 hypothetical protein CFR78_09130 [Komagataeibacter rhaeticus]
MAGTIRTAALQHDGHDEERLGAVSVAGSVERRGSCELGYPILCQKPVSVIDTDDVLAVLL